MAAVKTLQPMTRTGNSRRLTLPPLPAPTFRGPGLATRAGAGLVFGGAGWVAGLSVTVSRRGSGSGRRF